MTLVESMYYRWSNISRFGIQGMLDCYIQSVTFFSERVSRKSRPISFTGFNLGFKLYPAGARAHSKITRVHPGCMSHTR